VAVIKLAGQRGAFEFTHLPPTLHIGETSGVAWRDAERSVQLHETSPWGRPHLPLIGKACQASSVLGNRVVAVSVPAGTPSAIA
jgi:hypothetical protein